jgi:hypothetical protein
MQVADSQIIANLHFCLSSDSGELIEHIYEFLMIVERILQKNRQKIQMNLQINYNIFFKKGVQSIPHNNFIKHR